MEDPESLEPKAKKRFAEKEKLGIDIWILISYFLF